MISEEERERKGERETSSKSKRLATKAIMSIIVLSLFFSFTIFRNTVSSSLGLIREPVNSTDRKIGAFLRGGHPRFRCATCAARERDRRGTRREEKKDYGSSTVRFFFLTANAKQPLLSVVSRLTDKSRTGSESWSKRWR